MLILADLMNLSLCVPNLTQVLQIDEMKVKLSALKALFDQLMMFGIEPFKAKKSVDFPTENEDNANKDSGNEDADAEVTKETEEETVTAHNLLQLLSGFLDSEVRWWNQILCPWRIQILTASYLFMPT